MKAGVDNAAGGEASDVVDGAVGYGVFGDAVELRELKLCEGCRREEKRECKRVRGHP